MLSFDINISQLQAVADELGASSKQFYIAHSAALRRTATTLRTMAAKGLRSELELRTINLLRKRLKQSVRFAGANRFAGASLWVGTNDMPASWFKGRAKKTASGAEKRGHNVKGGFIAKSKFRGRLTILKRKGSGHLPIEEQNLPVNEEAVRYVEDRIFSQVEEIYWKNFVRDLRARVTYSIGEK